MPGRGGLAVLLSDGDLSHLPCLPVGVV